MPRDEGFGLLGMRERVSIAGGELVMARVPKGAPGLREAADRSPLKPGWRQPVREHGEGKDRYGDHPESRPRE